eukprot:1338276-Amphidinium_carterae.2
MLAWAHERARSLHLRLFFPNLPPFIDMNLHTASHVQQVHSYPMYTPRDTALLAPNARQGGSFNEQLDREVASTNMLLRWVWVNCPQAPLCMGVQQLGCPYGQQNMGAQQPTSKPPSNTSQGEVDPLELANPMHVPIIK